MGIEYIHSVAVKSVEGSAEFGGESFRVYAELPIVRGGHELIDYYGETIKANVPKSWSVYLVVDKEPSNLGVYELYVSTERVYSGKAIVAAVQGYGKGRWLVEFEGVGEPRGLYLEVE